MTASTRNRIMTALTVAIVLLSAAAFVRAQVLKQEVPPIHSTKVGERVLPGCDCQREQVDLRFGLRRGQPLTAAIVDEDEDVVRTLLDYVLVESGEVRLEWDGTGDDGAVAAEGPYRLRVVTAVPERTITLPEEIDLRLPSGGVDQPAENPL